MYGPVKHFIDGPLFSLSVCRSSLARKNVEIILETKKITNSVTSNLTVWTHDGISKQINLEASLIFCHFITCAPLFFSLYLSYLNLDRQMLEILLTSALSEIQETRRNE